jgi:hypothetical protein
VLASSVNYTPKPLGNLLLRSLCPEDAQLIAPFIERVALQPGQVLATPDTQPATIYFPETAILSFREGLRKERQPALGLAGLEGMSDWSMIIGPTGVSLLTIVEMHGGTALAIPSERVFQACAASPRLHSALLRYSGNFVSQMMSTINSNALDGLERRVARWILMIHDRTEGDVLALTHDDIAQALHVRRAGVTECLHALEGDHIIRSTRGKLEVKDRVALADIAGCAYGRTEASYAEAIGPFGK